MSIRCKLLFVIILCSIVSAWAQEACAGGPVDQDLWAIDVSKNTDHLSGSLGQRLAKPTTERFTFQAYGSGSFGDDAGELYTAHVGLGYLLRDDLSVNLEVIAGEIDIDQGRMGSAWVAGLDLLVRWHFARGNGWTIYTEGGAGLQQSADPFPVGGTHFNFRPQMGVGFTLRFNHSVNLMAGARWLHISNADKDSPSDNPGYDAAMIYSGFMIRF